MKLVELEVYSEASNQAVVRLPGRHFPGSLIQGDSLSIICEDSKALSQRIQQLGISDEEVLSLAQTLQEQLLERLLHYQQVLAAHELELPYQAPVSENDLVALMAEQRE